MPISFQITQRLFNALSVLSAPSSGHNAVWHGYASYNPTMMQTYLTVFWTVNNFILVGEDGRTPAMRSDFTK